MTPPTAFDPYNNVAGPRTISTRSSALGSIGTLWSPDELLKSPVRMPSCMMSTRSPSKPRMIGRAAPGPKLRMATPGSFFNASPSVGAGLVINSNESSVVMALKASNTVSWPLGAAVIVSSSWTGVSRSSKSATAVSPAPTVTVCRFAVKCSRWASSSYVPGVTPSISKLPSSSVSASYRVPTTSTTAPCTGLPSSNETCPRTTAPSCALAPSTNRPNRTATLRALLALARYAFISLLSSTRTAVHGHTPRRPLAHNASDP